MTSAARRSRAEQRLGRGRELLRLGWTRLRGGELTPLRAAWSVAIGLAIGLTPLYGLHLALVLALCLPLRLDAAVAYVASNVSLPFLAPFLVAAEITIGAAVLGEPVSFAAATAFDKAALAALGRELVVGTAVLAPLTSAVAFTLTFALLSRARARRRARPSLPPLQT